MKHLVVRQIADEIGGKVVAGNEELLIKSVSAKMRKVRGHTLIFDVKRRFTGSRAIRFGEQCAVVTEQAQSLHEAVLGLTVVYVENVTKAYWRFVKFYRGLFSLPVINVTGTCGKTTTKEMIKHILSADRKVQATEGSYNTPVTHLGHLLGIDERTEAAVFEVSANAPGLLIKGGRYFQPSVGVITNIGVDHLFFCKTLDNYIQAKAELLAALKYKGTLALNADDENIRKIRLEPYRGNVLYFGIKEKAHFKGEEVKYTKGGMKFRLVHQNRSIPAFLPVYGEHNVYNALAAVTTVYALGIEPEEAVGRLRTFRPVERHLEITRGMNGCTIIDDTWSSNPTSAESALRTLKQLAKGRKTIAVFGRMRQLGAWKKKYHEAVGQQAVESEVDVLISIGALAGNIGRKALQLGMDPSRVYICKDSAEADRALRKEMNRNSVVLVKTSMLDSFTEFMDRIKA